MQRIGSSRHRGIAPRASSLKQRRSSDDPEPRKGVHLEMLGRYVRAHSGRADDAAADLNQLMPRKKFCVSEHEFSSWQTNSGKWIPRRAALTDRVLALSKDPASPIAVHLVPLHEITTVTPGSSTLGRAVSSAGLNRASLDESDASVLQVVTQKVAFMCAYARCQRARTHLFNHGCANTPTFREDSTLVGPSRCAQRAVKCATSGLPGFRKKSRTQSGDGTGTISSGTCRCAKRSRTPAHQRQSLQAAG